MALISFLEKTMHRWLTPPNVLNVFSRYHTWVWFISVVCLVVGVFTGLFTAPKDEEMGDGYRIIFVHVPVAVMSMAVYTLMAVWALGVFVYNNRVLAIMIRKASLIGMMFTALALVTGSIWGYKMWGTWWEWEDARLVSELILLFIYIGHATLLYSLPHNANSDKLGAIVLMVGVVNIPIIHYSVYWWTSLHQGATLFKLGTPSIHSTMLWPLLFMLIGCMGLFLAYVMTRTSSHIMQFKIRNKIYNG